ncbi:MAG: class I tRNA ligase family protein [Candidatus Parcubacteria bacterium]|nr:class I tRNA ligase family protein [Candidatus Parcubacteria bacterium]
MLRASQTAQIVAKELGIGVIYDERLRENNVGSLNGNSVEEGERYFNPENKLTYEQIVLSKFKNNFPGGENYSDIKLRMIDFINDIDKKYENKNILIVSHEVPIMMLESIFSGWTNKEAVERREEISIKTGELRELSFHSFPYNEEAELDFHKPYIDRIEFICPKCRKIIKRVPEVMDCWLDSGSMPFAQRYWPFNSGEKMDRPPELFPADYISEAIDQTRGWFYTLLAISSLLGFGPSYKNVVVLGHVLDESGQKMSKSKGNVIDPWLMIEKYGADALRWYLYTVNQPGYPKLFTEKDIDKALKKFIMTFWNCYVFLQTYRPKDLNFDVKSLELKNPLDKWILSRLNSVIKESTDNLDEYNITTPARLIENFIINDFSLWYIRRSRNRLQRPKTQEEAEETASVFAFVLIESCKLAAPFVPFLSEEIYRNLKNNDNSVHLEDWPKIDKSQIDNELEEKMNIIREIVTAGLKIRSDEGIKVRQPLKNLKIKSPKLKLEKDLLELIQDELNVRRVEIEDSAIQSGNWELEYDFEIDGELKDEGLMRDIMRLIQDMRKTAGCKPEDKITVFYSTSGDLAGLISRKKQEFLFQVGAEDIISSKENKGLKIESTSQVDGQELWLGLKL